MIDSHAHVAFYQFDGDRDSVISRAHEAGVSWIEIGTDLEQSRRALELARQYGGRSSLLGVTIGVHPSDVGQGINWAEIEKLLDEPKVVAIGEVGIDLYHQDNLEEQLEALESFIGLAREKNLPVVFHVRNSNPPPPPPLSRRGDESYSLDKGRIGGVWNAHDEMIKFLQDHNWNRGVIHTFSGTKAQAEQYLEMGLYLSFSGVVTFKNAGEILEVAKTMPLDKMLIETDCPFLSPEPFRGKRNEPAYVKYVAEKIAEVRGISFDEVARATEENTRKLFLL